MVKRGIQRIRNPVYRVKQGGDRDTIKKAAAPRQHLDKLGVSARRPTARNKKTVRQDKLMGMVVKGTEIPFDVRRLKV